jgi:Programmed cell death protein 2, C-terminal putative domain
MNANYVGDDNSLEPWILGYASKASHLRADLQEGPCWTETHLGGSPVWPPDCAGVAVPQCKICGRLVVLILQAFAPTFAHPERILYVFACNSIRCAGDPRAWSCARLFKRKRKSDFHVGAPGDKDLCDLPQRPKESDLQARSKAACSTLVEDSGESSDDDINDLEALLNLHSLKLADKLKNGGGQRRPNDNRGIQNLLEGNCTQRLRGEASVHHSSFPEAAEGCSMLFPNALWLNIVPIDVDFEQPGSVDDCAELDQNVRKLLEIYLASEAASDDGGGWTEEPDEVECERKVAEQRFRERIARSPGHVLRYKFNGLPLWPSFPPPSKPQNCECGAARVFELQLLATCLHYLKVDSAVPDSIDDAGMNWAAAGVYSCQNDCEYDMSPDASWVVRWERVCVQPDEF